MPKLKTTIEIEIEVEFDYHKAEMGTSDCPGCPEEIAIDTIKDLNGWDLESLWKKEDEIEDLIWANRDSWKED